MAMDHTTALNLILAHACPDRLDVDGDPDTREFTISTHCVEFTVIAKLVSTLDTIQYDIVSCMPKE